jgi:hypothetical protein
MRARVVVHEAQGFTLETHPFDIDHERKRTVKKIGLGLAACTLAATAFAGQVSAKSMSMSYTAKLNGMNETPMGAKHGSGTAKITLNASAGTVCYNITVMGIKLPAVAAHIHAGKMGKNGPIAVPFPTAPGKTGHAMGCVKNVRAALIKGMENHPTSYYVNVHTTDYPGGAVRGQL